MICRKIHNGRSDHVLRPPISLYSPRHPVGPGNHHSLFPTSSICFSFCEDLTEAEAAMMALSCWKKSEYLSQPRQLMG